MSNGNPPGDDRGQEPNTNRGQDAQQRGEGAPNRGQNAGQDRVPPTDQPATGKTRSSVAQSSDPYLMDGEEVIIDARPAWTAWFAQLLLAGLLVIAGLVTGDGGVIALTILLAIAIVGYVAYQRRKVRYLVTDKRILVATGLSASATNETWMVDVRGMQTGASLLERFLGHGHISVSSSIMSGGALLSFTGIQGMTLGGISNYQEVAEVIRQRQLEAKHDG